MHTQTYTYAPLSVSLCSHKRTRILTRTHTKMVEVHWEQLPRTSASAILSHIITFCCQIDESPTEALQRICYARDFTTIPFRFHEIECELTLGDHGKTMTLSYLNLAAAYIRSVSCFSVQGFAIAPPILNDGQISTTPTESTRKDDRDTQLSRLRYGKEGIRKAFNSSLFQLLDPKSDEFLEVAKQVRERSKERDNERGKLCKRISLHGPESWGFSQVRACIPEASEHLHKRLRTASFSQTSNGTRSICSSTSPGNEMYTCMKKTPEPPART